MQTAERFLALNAVIYWRIPRQRRSCLNFYLLSGSIHMTNTFLISKFSPHQEKILSISVKKAREVKQRQIAARHLSHHMLKSTASSKQLQITWMGLKNVNYEEIYGSGDVFDTCCMRSQNTLNSNFMVMNARRLCKAVCLCLSPVPLNFTFPLINAHNLYDKHWLTWLHWQRNCCGFYSSSVEPKRREI